MNRKEPFDLFSAMTDVDDRDVLEALDIYKRNPKCRRIHRMMAVAAALIVLVSVGFATHWLLQKENGKINTDISSDERSGNRLNVTVEPVKPSMPVGELALCEIYQFMRWRDTEYIASLEDCDCIGAELGTARVRNEEKETAETLFKDVIVYEFVGIDSSIAVIVFFPEAREYYVYYGNSI